MQSWAIPYFSLVNDTTLYQLQGDYLLMSKTGSTFRPLNKIQQSWDLIHSDPKAGQFLIVLRTKKEFINLFLFQTGKKIQIFCFGRFYLKILCLKKRLLIFN